VRQQEDRQREDRVKGGDRGRVVAQEREHALDDAEDGEAAGEEERQPRQPREEGEHDEHHREHPQQVAEDRVSVEAGRAEDAEAGQEELNDDYDEEEPGAADVGDSEEALPLARLVHGGNRTPSARGYRARVAIATGRDYGLFIGGVLAEPASGEVRELIEPASGEPLARAAMAGPEDVDRAVAAARAALDGAWGKTPPAERSRLLHALADALLANRSELAELETRNAGKPIASTRGEVAGTAEVLRYYAGAVSSIEGKANAYGSSFLFYALKEPVGVCAQIVPWNYPLLMAGWKLGPALAAGCPVVLKPDPQTPLTALRLAELAAEAGFPAGAINVIPAEGPTTGAYLVSHPGVDKVAFTGSTRTGAEIMRLCADGIKRLTLELGGKSPNVVFADASLGEVVPASTYAFCAGAGQSCECRSRLLVEKPVYDQVVAGLADAAGRVKVGDPLDPETQVGSLISARHRERVHGFVESGREEGAEVVSGGEIPPGKGAFYPPTVLAHVDNRMTVAQEEVFGPVVAVIPFEDEDEAVRIANDTRYGLYATVWTSDPGRGHRLAQRLKAGQVAINTPYTTRPGVPFGGYKQSGFGRELALETIESYLETKGVLVGIGTKPANPYGL